MYTEKDLFSNNDEQNRGNFDTDVGILELFGKEPLENLQSIISKVTGLGFVTADFRGEPLTCMTGFTPFCKFTRERGNNGKLCNLSDAFGIVRSAITRKYCIYFCPCGLMEVAIPIIVHGKFLGGFLPARSDVTMPQMIFHASLVLFSQNILRKIRLRLMNTLRNYQLMNTKNFQILLNLST